MEPRVSLAVAARQSRAATAEEGPPGRAAGRQQAALIGSQRCRAPSVAAPVGRQPGRRDRPVIGGLVRRAHGELVHIELAEHHRAVAPQIRGDGQFVPWLEALENVAARLGVDPFRRVKVLHANRQPLERGRFFSSQAPVSLASAICSALSAVTATNIFSAPGALRSASR